MEKNNEKNLKSKFEKRYLGAVGTIDTIRDIALNDSITKKLIGKKGQYMSAGVFVEDDVIHFVKTSERDNSDARRIIIAYDILISSYGPEGVPCEECRECEMFLLSKVVITDIEFININ